MKQRFNVKVILVLVMMVMLSGCKKETTDTSSNAVTPTAAPSLTVTAAPEEPTAAAEESEATPVPEQTKEDTTSKVIYDKDSALKDVFSDYFLMGGAINGMSAANAAINHEGMRNILIKHFNSTTVSNLLKPANLLNLAASRASSDGMPVLNFTNADPSLKFCLDNNIKMRGHVLVWYTQTPDWFFYEGYDNTKKLVDKATMELRMESYIKQAIEYCQDNYPGVIYCWDVVNEAYNDNGTIRTVDNYWYKTMKEDYIEKAFFYARKYADPEVKLFYNEYNVFVPSKRLAMSMMAFNLKKKGLIDGLGLQPTVGLNTPELDTDSAGSFKTTLEKFATLGLEIQITELSFMIDDEGDGKNLTPENLQKQADRYYEMMSLLLKMDTDNGGPCNITSVTVFGICDDYPLYPNHKQNLYLWDKQAQPKAAYYSYLQAGLDWQASLLNK